EILQKEFLRPLGISQYRLAKALTVPPRRINEIVQGKRGVTADTALRLARHFGTSERFWLNLQARYDLEIEKDRLGDRLRREVEVLVPAGEKRFGRTRRQPRLGEGRGHVHRLSPRARGASGRSSEKPPAQRR